MNIENDNSPEEFKNAVDSQPQTVYAGIDPSASSLHIGHLIPLLCLLHFQTRGHNVISLVSMLNASLRAVA